MNRRILISFIGSILFALISISIAFILITRFQNKEVLVNENLVIENLASIRGDTEKIKESIENFKIENKYAVLTNPEGEVIEFSIGIPEELKRTEKPHDGVHLKTLADGRKYYQFEEKLSDGNYLRVFSFLVSDTRIFKKYFSYILTALIVVLLLSLFIALRLSRFLMVPIEDLINATSQIAKGELSSRVKIYRNAELGILANNFNEMADRLENTIIDSFDKQNQLEAILTSMNSGVIAVDKNGKIIIFNDFAKKIFGIFGEVIGKNLEDVLKKVNIKEMMIVKPEFSELEIGTNDVLHLRYKTTNLTGDNKNGVGKVTVLSDVTDLKKLEKMRTQFVANVSHELKTPLTSIKGFSETLRDVHDEKTKNKFLDIIDAEAERLRRLIEDILSLSSIENQKEMNKEIVNAVNITMDTCSLVELQAKEKNIEFALITKGDPKFIGDIDKYKQLVINLVDNAIKYTEPRGKVKVRLEERKDDFQLIVDDSGVGISEEHIPRLFERFYRVDKSRDRAKGGTGLGLAIVKHIVIGFNGDIEVESQIGKGTKFIVTIPLYKEEGEAQNHKIKSFRFNG